MSVDEFYKVLLIDDDPAIGATLCEGLSLRNIHAFHARDIQEARVLLTAHPDLSLVLVDFHMPGMAGPEIIDVLRRETARALCFIMLTGDETQAAAIEALRAHVFDFLGKPPDMRMLVETLRRAHIHLTVSAGPLPVAEGPEEPRPFDLTALAERMMPAIERLAQRRLVQFKARVPARLPFLYAGPKTFARALGDLSAALIEAMSRGDWLSIGLLNSDKELILTYQILSASMDEDILGALVRCETQNGHPPEPQKASARKAVAAYVLLQKQGARLRIDQGLEGQKYVRLFFPIRAEETKRVSRPAGATL